MSRQFFSEATYWATGTATAIANSATETIMTADVTIPANYMQDGRVIRARIFGQYGTTATPTLIFSVRWGGVSGTVLAKSAANVMTSGVGSGATMTAMFEGEILIQTRSNGASGTLMTNGNFTIFTATAGTAGTVTNYGMPVVLASGSTGGTTPVAVTADLTADKALSITAKWSAADPANSLQVIHYTLESLN